MKNSVDAIKDTSWRSKSVIKYIVLGMGIGTSLFFLYTAYFGKYPAMVQRGVLLTPALLAIFILYPISPRHGYRSSIIIDICLMISVALPLIYLMLMWNDIQMRGGAVTQFEIFLGTILTIAVLEAARRGAGLAVALVSVGALVYGFTVARMDFEHLVTQLYTSFEGIMGLATGAIADLYIFILFGAFFRVFGAGQFFMDSTTKILGGVCGGRGK